MQTSEVSALSADEHASFRKQIEIEAALHDVRIRVTPHLHDFVAIDRGGHPNRIFLPQPGVPCLAILAVKGTEVIGAWACIAFDTGHESLREFLLHSSFYPEGQQDNWMFTGEALSLSRQMAGTMLYCGGLWVKPGHRGNEGSRFGPWWSRNVGLLGRSIMEERIQPDWHWLISDFGGVAEKVAHRFALKQIAPQVEWFVDGVSRDGPKILGLQDRENLTRTVRDRLAR